MSDKAQFEAGLHTLGLSLTTSQREKFDAYVALLRRWQKAFNLIGPKTATTIYTRHILDSLQLVPHLATGGRILDIGSGAGLPAVVLAIMEVGAVTACERNGKKVQFLNTVRRELGLSDSLTILQQDVYSIGAPVRLYDVVTARAFAATEKILEAGLPLLKEDGFFLLLKGASLNDVSPNTRYTTPLKATTYPSVTSAEGKIVLIKPGL